MNDKSSQVHCFSLFFAWQ